MQKLVIGMSVSRGFTLIEILVVIVIIGITIGFALLAFGDFGQERRILFFAENMVNSIRLAQQQAILETSTMGIRIDNKSYQILKYQNGWNSASNKGIFKTVFVPSNAVLNLKTNSHAKSGSPSIIINASGDMTPFTLNVGSLQNPSITILEGKQDGSLTFRKAK